MARLEGKVAIVTGGGSGIGRGIVLAMAKEGADIAIPDIQVLNAEKAADEVKALGRRVLAMKCDVTSTSDVKLMVDRTRDVLGRIDVLVNNAGIASPPGMPFTNNTEEDWDRTFAVNTKSVFLTSYLMDNQATDGQAGQLARAQILGGDWRLARLLPERIRQVTAADVQRFARSFIGRLQMVVLGDPAKIDRGLFTSM